MFRRIAYLNNVLKLCAIKLIFLSRRSTPLLIVDNYSSDGSSNSSSSSIDTFIQQQQRPKLVTRDFINTLDDDTERPLPDDGDERSVSAFEERETASLVAGVSVTVMAEDQYSPCAGIAVTTQCSELPVGDAASVTQYGSALTEDSMQYSVASADSVTQCCDVLTESNAGVTLPTGDGVPCAVSSESAASPPPTGLSQRMN